MQRGMKITTACLTGALLLLPLAGEARDGKITVAGALSKTNLSIDPDYRIGVGNSSFEAGGISVMGGYQFGNGFLVEAGFVGHSTFEFFNALDDYKLNDWQVAAGYAYALESWRFVAKAGYAFWKLEAEQGRFLNPGDEDQRRVYGSDPVWTLSVEKFFSRIFGMSLSYQVSDREFGDVETFALGIKFAF